MTISFKHVREPDSEDLPLVFFAFDGDSITKWPLFRFLSSPEQDYLKKISKSVKTKEKESKVFILPGAERKLIAIGLGKTKDFNQQKAALAARIAVASAKREKLKKLGFWVSGMRSPKETSRFYEGVAVGATMANFEFVKYKTPPKEGFNFIEEIVLISAKADANIEDGVKRGAIIGEEVNSCRNLANTPAGDMTPKILAEHAERDARETPIKVSILDERDIKELSMGGILGVSRGSDEKPRFIVMEYWGGRKKERPIVLVGKGVTFDTGGLNLKPSDNIYEMHMDMSGGSAVIHTIKAAARLGIKKNIVVLVPAVENMPSGSSYHPGDVLRTMSGKTIEVLNTDAEGRVILADALSYAKKYNPRLVVDVATLTGAAMGALGLRYTGLFTPEQKLETFFRKIGEDTGDRVWPLPLSAEYEDDIKGTFGDWANISKTKYGGATTAAVFLWQWAKDFPWVHLDIAPRMTSIEGEYLAKGAAGSPVRLLIRMLEEF